MLSKGNPAGVTLNSTRSARRGVSESKYELQGINDGCCVPETVQLGEGEGGHAHDHAVVNSNS
jgi:hypothetical protein